MGSVEINPDSTHIITKPELIGALKRNDYLVWMVHDRVDAEPINASPNLKLIASMAITPSGVDVAAANARRIPVTIFRRSLPKPWQISIGRFLWPWRAESWKAIALSARGSFRQPVAPFRRRVKSRQNFGHCRTGAIGEAVARRAQGFRMRIRHRASQARRDARSGARCRVSKLDDLLKESDFVSVKCRA